jgi:hypothetical protein
MLLPNATDFGIITFRANSKEEIFDTMENAIGERCGAMRFYVIPAVKQLKGIPYTSRIRPTPVRESLKSLTPLAREFENWFVSANFFEYTCSTA